MDRYFDAKAKQGKSLELQELHISGVVAMFVASKFEDIIPLLLRTVYNKIGHKKISADAIRNKEIEMLRAIGFMVGAAPSPLEFLERYTDEVFG